MIKKNNDYNIYKTHIYLLNQYKLSKQGGMK